MYISTMALSDQFRFSHQNEALIIMLVVPAWVLLVGKKELIDWGESFTTSNQFKVWKIKSIHIFFVKLCLLRRNFSSGVESSKIPSIGQFNWKKNPLKLTTPRPNSVFLWFPKDALKLFQPRCHIISKTFLELIVAYLPTDSHHWGAIFLKSVNITLIVNLIEIFHQNHGPS